MSSLYAPDLVAYAEAVEDLLDLASRHPGTSGARAAAEVLLSCYKSYDFHLAPHEVRTFNERRLQDAALTVIVQSVLVPKEPHQVVPGGEQRFRALHSEYEAKLHVRHRYQTKDKSDLA